MTGSYRRQPDRPKADNLGLIVVELVINSLKHAFGNAAKAGLIVVTCDAVETECTLSVSDNGQSKLEHAEVGLGTGIVAALARQLNALVVTESGAQGISIPIAHQGAKAV